MINLIDRLGLFHLDAFGRGLCMPGGPLIIYLVNNFSNISGSRFFPLWSRRTSRTDISTCKIMQSGNGHKIHLSPSSLRGRKNFSQNTHAPQLWHLIFRLRVLENFLFSKFPTSKTRYNMQAAMNCVHNKIKQKIKLCSRTK